ncbi:phosphonoacetaldehyde hydrolase [Altererythrobacter xixiisoli]|uniref:Phosphonoacetaldehyde hydrolase n=1 Tax=Croceibacterium xixiisoli TaxID=1476466 RepID=A0A6I4TWL1_9SPHN|nr:phosphonoacetaldehyde hydrolase [Croceibacterium xixiisoli]MXP00243.1 phosphonoacetaldehyde hydrolase [Croceibacterium xixiisoli]
MTQILPRQPYSGPLTLAIFDWAGTVLDFGCLAPVRAFREAFEQAGVAITEAEARAPMGAAKREHIELILMQPSVQPRWRAVHGKTASQQDIDDLYAAFLRIDAINCARYSDLVPGTLDTIAELRGRGMRIGSTTGYPRSVMDGLMPLAEAQGYVPDACFTVSEVAQGRPAPDMVLANALALGVPDMRAGVVVDDSPSGLLSGRAAGMWAVGILASGNEVGLPLAAWEALDDDGRDVLRRAARPALEAAGAHYVIDSVAGLLPVIDAINLRLAAGEAP